MGLINLEPTLRDGEEVRWRRSAALCVGPRTVAGQLIATSLGLVFMPNRLNRRRDLVARRIPYGDLTEIAVQEREPSLTKLVRRDSSALQRRLRLQTRHGDTLLLVVRRPDEVVAALAPAGA